MKRFGDPHLVALILFTICWKNSERDVTIAIKITALKEF